MVTAGAASTFSFVHAADLHLDTPFKGIGATAPHVAARLREASLDAFDALVELCLERQAAFLVLAGDLYDGPERGLRAQLRLRDGLGRLSDAGISSFVVHGNHDPVETGWSALGGAWPELVTVFGAGEVGAVTLERAGVPLATIQGVSYASRHEERNLALGFAADAGPGLAVGVLHCNVRGAAAGYDDYSPCTLAELQAAGIDYWALGHIHTRLVLSGRPGGAEPYVVYPGNLQARSPKPSERGPKGATVVEVVDGRVAGLEAVACDVVRFAALEVDIARAEDLGVLRQQLAAAALAELERSDGRSLVVRATLVGRGPLAGDLRRPGNVDELVVAVREELCAHEPFVWLDALADASAPALDLEALRAGGDFAADLVGLAEALAARLGDDEGLLAELEAELNDGLPAGARRAGVVEQLLEGPGASGEVRRALLVALAELGPDAG